MDKFNHSLSFVQTAEGGYSNHKNDRGGATNYGVTHATFDEAQRTGIISKDIAQVKDITKEDADKIYKEMYWNKINGDALPADLSVAVFDMAVNCGPSRAAKELQKAVDATPDGKIGPKTLSAIKNYKGDLLADYLKTREDFYKKIVANDPSQACFLKGWLNRIDNLRKYTAKPGPSKATGANVLINGRTAVHAGSGGVLTTVDVCWTKIGKVTVPIPYTNVARSADTAKTSTTVFINGHPVCHQKSIFAVSTGDEPGNRKGIRSGTIKGKAEFVTGSPNVFIEGIPAVRQGDLMVSNNGNTAPMPLSQPGAPRPRQVQTDQVEELDETKLPNEVILTVCGGKLHMQHDLVGYSINARAGSTLGTPSTPADAELSSPAATPIDELKSDGKSKPDLVIGVFFDGTGNNMMAQPADQHTNVAKLRSLYNSPTTLPIYIQGVGTKAVGGSDGSLTQETSLFGLGMGLGPYGGEARLKQARRDVHTSLRRYHAEYGPPEKIIFDVFGFSRGAMLARHFVNMVHAGLPDLTQAPVAGQTRIFPDLREAETTSAPPSPFSFVTRQALYPRLEAAVSVRFLGIFDSVGSFYWPGNDSEGFINGHLAESSADFVYHPVASAEIRHNFPLTSISPGLSAAMEETLFGVHSDIGGGYGREPERFFLGQTTYYRPDFPLSHLGINDPIWCEEIERKAREIGQENGIICAVEFSPNAAQFYEIRPTKPDLSKVALKAMHDKAVAQGVPLEEIKTEDKIPPDLVQLIERARSGDTVALKKLDDEYIHTSHRKLAVLALRGTIGMDPAEGEKRNVFQNRPERAIKP